jgi:peptidoglycan-associated lipoprotein
MNVKAKFLGALVFVAFNARAQYIIKEANTQATLYNYAAAVPLYEKAYHKKPTAAAARGAADGYRLLKQYSDAANWYAILDTMQEHTAADELHYAGVLMSTQQYDAAKSILKNHTDDRMAANMLAGCDSAASWLKHPVRGDFENMKALNSEWSDWGMAFHNGFIYASDRPYDSLRHDPVFNNSNISRKEYGYTGNSYLHLYNGTQLLPRTVNGDFHSATASYTADGKTLYYAETKLVKKKGSFLGKDNPYTLNVEIKGAQWSDSAQGWQALPEFPYNEIFNHSLGDPFISPDGNTLYFTVGDSTQSTDIYYTRKSGAGWGAPVKMGPEVNTPGNERTPMIDHNGVFYFATDGRPGLGGLDIFKLVDGVAVNMGAPVNSAGDDFAPAYNHSTTIYFSSNRPGGHGSDDIYRFTPYRVLVFDLHGKALDKKTHAPLADVTVTVLNMTTGKEMHTTTDDNGRYSFKLDSISDYESLHGERVTYRVGDGKSVTTKGLNANESFERDLYLEKIEMDVVAVAQHTDKPIATPGVQRHQIDLTGKFNPANIYFDLGKADVRPDAAKELDKLIALMKENPSWKVDMSFHTDSRADDNYNMKLSERRAASTLKYFLSKGIAKSRLTAKGYGETRLVNGCKNGVPCTEAEHQANRRTEFVIFDK